MSILDIIDKDKLKSILSKENFEIIQQIYNEIVNEKINKQKLEEVKKEIDKEYPHDKYFITEISITRGGKKKEEWDDDEYYNKKEYVKYKYSVNTNTIVESLLMKDKFELIIIECNRERTFTTKIHMNRMNNLQNIKDPNSKNFTKISNCDFFLNKILFDPDIRYDEDLIDIGNCNSDLSCLDPIKLIHEKFQGVDDFYYCL